MVFFWSKAAADKIHVVFQVTADNNIPCSQPQQDLYLPSELQKRSRVQHFSKFTMPTNHLGRFVKCGF